jgi:hypothetical protein
MIVHYFNKGLRHLNGEVCDCNRKTVYPSFKESYPGKAKDLRELQEEIRGIHEQ